MNKFSKKLINRSILKAKNISISPLEMNVKQKKKIKKKFSNQRSFNFKAE